MDGNCNAGSVLLKQKGWYKNFQVWLNEHGIVNLLSIPMLEEAGYKVSTHTDDDWKVTTPRGEVIVFKPVCVDTLYPASSSIGMDNRFTIPCSFSHT